MNENAYDHHTAIYYLLVDRLKQHRASYPLQPEVETKLRRPSGIADAAVVRTNLQLDQDPKEPRSIQRICTVPPIRPYLHLQYAINELHDRIPTPPEIRREIANECVREMSPVRELGSPKRSMSPRLVRDQSYIENISPKFDNLEKMESDEEDTEIKTVLETKVIEKPKVRRHTVHTTPKGRIEAPAGHPLLRSQASTGGIPPEASAFSENLTFMYKSPCVQTHGIVTSNHMTGSGHHLHLQRREPPAQYHPQPQHHPCLSRRASDGNTVIPFLQQNVRENATLNRIRQLQQEHLKLQEQYQKSLSPSELSEQQALHVYYKKRYSQMRKELQRQYERLMSDNEQHVEQESLMNQNQTVPEISVSPEQNNPLYPSEQQKSIPHYPLLSQFQQLQIDNNFRVVNPVRKMPYQKQNPHKQICRTSSYKQAQMCTLLPPLEGEQITELNLTDNQTISTSSSQTNSSVVAH